MPRNGDTGSLTPAPPRAPARPWLIELLRPDPDAMRAELVAGLTAPAATIAPKYFYDALGARLFAAITELPEYYPTRTEASIFAAHLSAIVDAYGVPDCTLIDLGAGNCEKAARLFNALRPAAYVALDIAVEYLTTSLECLQREFPSMKILGVGTDFTRSLALPDEVARARRLFFYPGSSIGNFTPAEAAAFLAQVRAAMTDDGALLIGVDLVKDTRVLRAAYDDALGVTAAFNLNVLNHVNRLVGADFDSADWRHVAFYDPEQQRIEMHLQARQPVTIRWNGGERRFARGERIHTENSYKYAPAQFAALLQGAGFRTQSAWTDERDWFALFLARAQ
jgi:dimethylhistidine N-methyltransferase